MDWTDWDESMVFCSRCKNPLVYVIVERKETYRELPMKAENLRKIEYTYSFVCSKCGNEIQGTTYTEEIPEIDILKSGKIVRR